MLLEANWKDNTARIYPDEGEPVQVAFPEELADDIQRAARHRVRVAGNLRRPRNDGQYVQAEELEVLDCSLVELVLEAARRSAPKGDPFANAKPIEDVWEFFAGCPPDDRSAEEAIADLRAYRVPHTDDVEEGD